MLLQLGVMTFSASWMARCTRNSRTPLFVEFVLRFHRNQWNATIAGNYFVRLVSHSGPRAVHSSALASWESGPAPTFLRNSFKFFRSAATIAKSLYYSPRLKSTKNGAKKTSAQIDSAKWYSNLDLGKNSSTRKKRSKCAMTSATRCSDCSRQWRLVTKTKFFYFLSSTLQMKRKLKIWIKWK